MHQKHIVCELPILVPPQAQALAHVLGAASVEEIAPGQATTPAGIPSTKQPGKRRRRRRGVKSTGASAVNVFALATVSGQTPAPACFAAAAVGILGLARCDSDFTFEHVKGIVRETLHCAVCLGFSPSCKVRLSRVLALQLLLRACEQGRWAAAAALCALAIQEHQAACVDVLFTVGTLAGHDAAHARVLAGRDVAPQHAALLLVLAVLRRITEHGPHNKAVTDACRALLESLRSFFRLHCGWNEVSLVGRLLSRSVLPTLCTENTVDFLHLKQPQQVYTPDTSHRMALMLASDAELCNAEQCCASVFGLEVPLPRPIPDHAVLSAQQLPAQWPASTLLPEEEPATSG